MKWSFKIGRVFGIGLYVHFTFLLLLAFLGFAAYSVSGSSEYALYQVGFILLLFGIVVLHELGHAMAARMYGIPTKDITLLPIGGLARLERIPREPIKEFVIAVAGPAVNVVLALAAFTAIVAVYGTMPWAMDALTGGNLLNRLFWVNVIMIAFNMIPAFPMDGGRVLRALLAMTMNHGKATRIAAGIGQALAVCFGIAGFIWGHPILMLIAVFVYMGAGQERAMASTKDQLSGVTVRRAMMTRFETLAPNESLGAALQQAMSGAQKDFPVLQHGRLIGILSRAEMRQAVEIGDLDSFVGDAMRPVVNSLKPEDPLEQALELFQQTRSPAIPVLEDGRLVGLLTVENLQEFLTMRHFLADRREPVPRTYRPRHEGEMFSRN